MAAIFPDFGRIIRNIVSHFLQVGAIAPASRTSTLRTLMWRGARPRKELTDWTCDRVLKLIFVQFISCSHLTRRFLSAFAEQSIVCPTGSVSYRTYAHATLTHLLVTEVTITRGSKAGQNEKITLNKIDLSGDESTDFIWEEVMEIDPDNV